MDIETQRFIEKNERSISIWMESYERLYNGKTEFRKRLKELTTWDTPLYGRGTVTHTEWEWKKEALKRLISKK